MRLGNHCLDYKGLLYIIFHLFLTTHEEAVNLFCRCGSNTVNDLLGASPLGNGGAQPVAQGLCLQSRVSFHWTPPRETDCPITPLPWGRRLLRVLCSPAVSLTRSNSSSLRPALSRLAGDRGSAGPRGSLLGLLPRALSGP